MAFTVFDALKGAYTKMGAIKFGMSTAGTSVTLNDMALNTLSDDDLNGQSLFIISAPNASSSVDGQLRRINDFTAGTGTITFSSVASTVGTDAVYGYTNGDILHEAGIEILNDALRSLGPLALIDRTTISSASQTVYPYSVAWKYAPPIRIDIMGNISSSSTDPDWRVMTGWHYEPASAGVAGNIVFDQSIDMSRDIRIWYQGHHPRVSSGTAPIDERLHPELIVLATVDKFYEYRNSMNRGSLGFDIQRWNDAKKQLEQAKIDYAMWKPKRYPKIFHLGDGEADHLPYPYPYGPA